MRTWQSRVKEEHAVWQRIGVAVRRAAHVKLGSAFRQWVVQARRADAALRRRGDMLQEVGSIMRRMLSHDIWQAFARWRRAVDSMRAGEEAKRASDMIGEANYNACRGVL